MLSTSPPDGYSEILLWGLSVWKLAQESIWHSVSMLPHLWTYLCGDTYVCLYNTSVIICVTRMFCVKPFGSVMFHLPITSLQRLMTKSWLN